MSFGYGFKTDFNPRQVAPPGALDKMSNFSSMSWNETIRDSVEISHPLERSEKNYHHNEHKLNMNVMKNVQGIHAPLRMQMELNACKNIGRLPFLSSSNLIRDIIMGRDDHIDFNDILNPLDMHEHIMPSHITMEMNDKHRIL